MSDQWQRCPGCRQLLLRWVNERFRSNSAIRLELFDYCLQVAHQENFKIRKPKWQIFLTRTSKFKNFRPCQTLLSSLPFCNIKFLLSAGLNRYFHTNLSPAIHIRHFLLNLEAQVKTFFFKNLKAFPASTSILLFL